jgi:TetR/AcrR family transcriptional regulator, ethionamide resistance regulator
VGSTRQAKEVEEAMTNERTPRRRRSPEEAEREILDAAESFLRERPFRELTVEEVMARTGLSRPAFYAYFRDRYGLVRGILERAGSELFEIDRGWLEGTGEVSRVKVRETLEGGAAFFARRGPLLRAVNDASSGDQEIERMYRFGLIERFAQAVTARIRQGQAEGEMSAELDPEAVGLALVLMTERYLLDTVSRDAEIDPEPIVEALTTIWTRTLYEPI